MFIVFPHVLLIKPVQFANLAMQKVFHSRDKNIKLFAAVIYK
jgi:hypothetical protein